MARQTTSCAVNCPEARSSNAGSTSGPRTGACRGCLVVHFVDVEITERRLESPPSERQLALITARQVKVPHQALARVVLPIPLVVHALAPVLAPVTVARVISRIEHGRPPDMALRRVGSSRRPGGCREGRFRNALSVRGVAPRGVQGVVVCVPGSGPLRRPSDGAGPRASARRRADSRPGTASRSIPPRCGIRPPTIDQVGPRGLLQFGTRGAHTLTGVPSLAKIASPPAAPPSVG